MLEANRGTAAWSAVWGGCGVGGGIEPSVGQVAVRVVVKHERKGLKNHHEAVRREAGGGGVDPRDLCVVPWEAAKEESVLINQYIHVKDM